MPRLLDEFMLTSRPPGTLTPAGALEAAADAAEARSLVPSATAIIVDNVADFFWAGTDQEIWDLEEDFPCVAPPLPFFWAEYRMPKSGVSSATGAFDLTSTGIDAVGALIAGAPGESGEGWDLIGEIVVKAHRTIFFGMGGFRLAVDGTGRPTPRLGDGFSMMITRYDDTLDGIDGRKNLQYILRTLLDPILLAICFLHCKNVILHAADVPPKLARAYARRHKRDLVSFHTIEIGPLRAVLASEGSQETVGLKRALHICRGHFATYSEERPLFGRIAGTIWVPAHVRGSRSEGLALKDYKVNRP